MRNEDRELVDAKSRSDIPAGEKGAFGSPNSHAPSGRRFAIRMLLPGEWVNFGDCPSAEPKGVILDAGCVNDITLDTGLGPGSLATGVALRRRRRIVANITVKASRTPTALTVIATIRFVLLGFGGNDDEDEGVGELGGMWP